MGEGEGINLCADGFGSNWENERNVRPLGKKDYALLNADYKYFRCCYYLFKFFLLFFLVGVFFYADRLLTMSFCRLAWKE